MGRFADIRKELGKQNLTDEAEKRDYQGSS
jgi:hypothetical protein